jgi:Ca2+-binding EF-hand superfamily protein
LDCESLSERLRQRLSRRPEFNCYDAFQAIDRDRNGFITYEEMKTVLEENGCKVSNRDLKCLMDRYDKNKDGRVSYSEFVQEVTPKSPRKY